MIRSRTTFIKAIEIILSCSKILDVGSRVVSYPCYGTYKGNILLRTVNITSEIIGYEETYYVQLQLTPVPMYSYFTIDSQFPKSKNV